MNSNASTAGKSLSTSSTTNYSPAPSQAAPFASFDPSRRQGSTSLTIQGTPRRSQGAKKQHRTLRRAGSGFVGGAGDEEDAMAEARIVRNASSRRGQTSITHLLNYALPPRPYQDHHSMARSYRRNPTWGPGSGHHAADKARYVHANYRFVVSPAGNYAMHASDADEHVQWSDVLQVIASAESQQASCPICLSEPVAPRMAKCGHIFCLPCLIRFMRSSGIGNDGVQSDARHTRRQKCPICDDFVYLSEVRPLRFYAGQESQVPRPGDDVVLRLMMRHAGSTLALPKEGGADALHSQDHVPWHFAATALDYARIMKGTAAYMEEQYDREMEHIQKQEKEDELLFDEGNEWTQKAIRSIKAAKDKMQGLGEAELALDKQLAANIGRRPHIEQDFYFYMTPPHVYLSPLDIRILKTKFGAFSAMPSTLLPRVEHISLGHSVDDALRKRARYLSHLPQGCLISFLECDWTDIVPADVLETFADEIARRRKRNGDKAAQEERERAQAERIEAAAFRGARRNLGAADEDVTVRFSATADAERSAIDPNEFLPLAAVGMTPPNPRSGFSHLQNMSTSPSAHRTVWGTTAVPGSPEIDPVCEPPATDYGWLRDGDMLETRGAAELAVQMEALGVDAPTEGPVAGGNTGKKKKKQKITLMTNGGRRGN